MKSSTDHTNILILGSNGKVGQMLRQVWCAHAPDGFRVLWQARKKMRDADFVWSIGDPVHDLPKISAIIALWGVTPGPNADLSDNVLLATSAIELGRRLNVERVLHCSSAAVYQPSNHPLKEGNTSVAPNAYGASKLEMETAIKQLETADPKGARQCAMRIGNVAGADSLFAAIRRGDVVTLDQFPNTYGPRRSYISVSDLGKCIIALLSCPLGQFPQVINIAANGATGMADLALAAGITVEWRKAPASAVPLVELDTSRLKSLINLGKSNNDPKEIINDWRKFGEIL